MKKLFKTVATTFLMLGLVACSNEEVSKKDGVKIGMVTDTGTREPSAAGTQLSPKECGERWGHYWKMATGAEH